MQVPAILQPVPTQFFFSFFICSRRTGSSTNPEDTPFLIASADTFSSIASPQLLSRNPGYLFFFTRSHFFLMLVFPPMSLFLFQFQMSPFDFRWKLPPPAVKLGFFQLVARSYSLFPFRTFAPDQGWMTLSNVPPSLGLHPCYSVP